MNDIDTVVARAIPLIDDTHVQILRVSSNSPVTAVAGSIANALREQPVVYVQAIGMSAVYQAIKAVVIARSYLSEEGLDLIEQPAYVTIKDRPGLERTAVRMTLWVYPL
ncbi:MAG: stage V sporulation protein S [Caldilineaceae bacterium]